MKLLRACYDPRVIAALVAVGVGIFVVAPGAVAVAVAAPILFLAVCPLSMLVMMRTMGGMQPSDPTAAGSAAPSTAPAEQAAELRVQLAAARREQQHLADELAQLQSEADLVPAVPAPPQKQVTAAEAR